MMGDITRIFLVQMMYNGYVFILKMYTHLYLLWLIWCYLYSMFTIGCMIIQVYIQYSILLFEEIYGKIYRVLVLLKTLLGKYLGIKTWGVQKFKVEFDNCNYIDHKNALRSNFLGTIMNSLLHAKNKQASTTCKQTKYRS